MDFFTNLIYGILFFGGGFLILKYRLQIKSMTGNFVWAEAYLGRGSTYLIIILIGCFMLFLGVAFPFGVLDFLFKK